MPKSTLDTLHMVADATTALAYYWLTYQLLAFAVKSKLVKISCFLWQSKDKKKRNLFFMLVSVAALFSSFISLCGTTHLISAIRSFYPSIVSIRHAQLAILVFCACVSVITAFIAYKLFPAILVTMDKFELTSEGNLQHAENYLVEVVEMIKESVMVMTEDLTIVRCNEASKSLLDASQCLNRNYKEFIHPLDREVFNNAVSRVMGSYSATPVTVEYRVKREASFEKAGRYRPGSKSRSPQSRKVHAADDQTAVEDTSPFTQREGSSISPMSANTAQVGARVNEYTWIESTICKGMTMMHGDHFEYDIKLVSRNIEDRKQAAQSQYQEIIRENEERARFNAAKLRYISCIAHDLKTPLQSFCFSLDLLNRTNLQEEQREYVQQANVAVDLMKLTISQTMDISKALKGVKLMPRRTTVLLASVINRVKIIINGYGKQVPVLFQVAPDLAESILTDEEWLWQMILNFLTNACKYTDRGEIKVVLSRKSSCAAEPEMLLVEVADTGVGVDDTKIGSIFEAFAQVQSGQVTGTGLGLYGVRTRAEGLNGTCGARHNTESSTGTGTVLWFAIPYVSDDSEDTGAAAMRGSVLRRSIMSQGNFSLTAPPSVHSADFSSIAEEGPSLAADEDPMLTFIRTRKISVMVVDDTLTVRKLMDRLLKKMGFASVVCYENGAKGLDAMMAAPVDIVFSDVQMPIMTGPEMVRRFRKFEAEALETGARQVRQLVVAVTANGSELTDSVNNGFDEVCPKPLGVQDIERIVQKYFV